MSENRVSSATLYVVEGENGVFRDWNGKQVRLATVHSPDWHEDYLCASREAFSNACMFSAAFEMYDALTKWKRAQDYQALYQDLPDARDDIAAAWEDALAAREAAVAKAEGRAPAVSPEPLDNSNVADENQ